MLYVRVIHHTQALRTEVITW